jgi:hypothetical protein
MGSAVWVDRQTFGRNECEVGSPSHNEHDELVQAARKRGPPYQVFASALASLRADCRTKKSSSGGHSRRSQMARRADTVNTT